MQNELKIFNNEEFGEIRTVTMDNEPWFVASDICKALDIQNVTQAVQKLDDDERSMFNIGRQGNANCVNEYGLYNLILASRKKEAKQFKRWVTHEVLPTLRKTGSYSVQKSPMQLLELEFAAIKEVDSKVDAVNEDLQNFKQDMPILGIEIDKITSAVKAKGVNVLGGKESNAYKDRSLRGKVYSDIYAELKRQFGVTTYKAIKRSQCEIAVDIIQHYELPIILKEQVVNCNAQMNMEVA